MNAFDSLPAPHGNMLAYYLEDRRRHIQEKDMANFLECNKFIYGYLCCLFKSKIIDSFYYNFLLDILLNDNAAFYLAYYGE